MSASPIVQRALRLSVIEGMLHAVMVGLSESYLGALAVELGHRDTALALLTTLPMMLGAGAQLLSGPLSGLIGGRKRVIVLGGALQAAAHVAFVAIAWTGSQSLAALLFAKIAFWISGSIIAPAWGAWMATLTEGVRRDRYFAWRSWFVNLALLGSLSAAGATLNVARQTGQLLHAFAILIAGALLARALSTAVLAAQHDPAAREPVEAGARRRIRRALDTGDWRIPFYLAALMFSAFISVPFFTPYMLESLQLTYAEFALVSGTAILTKALAFPLHHRLAVHFGLPSVLLGSGIGVALTPFLWAIAGMPEIYWVQVLSGASWAGLEYASYQLLLESSTRECRTEFLSLSGALSGIFQLLGALCGGQLLAGLALTYPDVFILSALLRGLSLGFLVVSAATIAATARLPKLFFRLLGSRPTAGDMRRPFVEEDAPPPDHPA